MQNFNLKYVIRKIGRLVMGIAIMAAVFLVTPTGSASASCVSPREQGSWVNADPNTRSITRANIRFICQDVILNGQDPGPSYYITLWGKCHPTDCAWGTVPMRRLSSGWLYGTYDQGFAKRHVYAKMSAYRTNQLYIQINNDFVDPGRADYISNDWFRR